MIAALLPQQLQDIPLLIHEPKAHTNIQHLAILSCWGELHRLVEPPPQPPKAPGGFRLRRSLARNAYLVVGSLHRLSMAIRSIGWSLDVSLSAALLRLRLRRRLEEADFPF